MKIKNSGVTLLELIIVISILSILATISVAGYFAMQRTSEMNNTAQNLISILKLGQSKTLSSNRYGVYFNTSTSPQNYTLFKGDSYATRDISADMTYSLPNSIKFNQINLSGNANQIVFNRLTGATDNFGNVQLQSLANSNTENIYVTNSGVISLGSQTTPTDTRIKDSRHVDLTYTRPINDESLTLTFDSGTTKNILMSSNMVGNQFYWQGKVNNQQITIHTLRLNDPDTEFSVFRDRTSDNTPLKITISSSSGDTPPNWLLYYKTDGTLDTSHESIYIPINNGIQIQ